MEENLELLSEDQAQPDGEMKPPPKTISEMSKQIADSRSATEATILDIIDEHTSFFGWGFTRPLKITRWDTKKKESVVEYKSLRIKSLGVNDLLENLQENAPTPPVGPARLLRKDNPADQAIMRELGVKQNILIRERNEAEPGYQKALRKYNERMSRLIVLKGLNYDLEYEGKPVVKGADPTIPNEIIDEAGALTLLRKLGFSGQHIRIMMDDITDLTSDRETQEDLE